MANEKVMQSDHIYDSSRGRFVNTEHERIASVLHDYNHHLSLSYAPSMDNSNPTDTPFFVGYRDENKAYIVMWLRADEINASLLAKIWSSDASKRDPKAFLKSLEDAELAIRLKQECDAREEVKDKAMYMLRSPLHTINLGNGKKVRT